MHSGDSPAKTDGVGGGVIAAGDVVLVGLSDAVDAVVGSGLCPASGKDAAGVLRALERESRRLQAAAVEVMNQIDQAAMFRVDGHANVKVQARHVARLSNGEANARAKTMRMLRSLPAIKAAFTAGQIGVDQVQLLARVYGNGRVRGAMELRQGRFIEQAVVLGFSSFETRVREWERLIDEDGPEPEGERTHQRRNASLLQDPIDKSWELVAKCAALQGATMHDIYGHYIDAEWRIDWDKAVDLYGDAASVADMERTAAQRRADALFRIFQDATRAQDSAVAPGFCHNIVWSADTYTEMLERVAGADPEPIDPDSYTCRTIDGVPLDANEAIVNSITNTFRRIVVDAAGVTLDMGHKRRFTGALRDAIFIQSNRTCIWPGCEVPASDCEADHVVEHSRGGRTNPGNGAPLCGMHNRLKQRGFTTHRDPTGTWHTHRPDGTQIDN